MCEAALYCRPESGCEPRPGELVDAGESSDAGVDAGYEYAWVAGDWGSCSASCGGGTQMMAFACERDDGMPVEDSLCAGPRPTRSQGCNEQPCCSADPWVPTQRCVGGSIIRWVQFHYRSDTGSAADRESCATDCVAWALATGTDRWCCTLGEDTTPGRSWSCALDSATSSSSFSHPDSQGSYVALGRCD